MSKTKFPARVEVSIAVKKRGDLSIQIENPDGEHGNHGGSVTVYQNNPDELTLALSTKDGRDVTSPGGSAYATLTKLQATDLCRNLAVRLGLEIK